MELKLNQDNNVGRAQRERKGRRTEGREKFIYKITFVEEVVVGLE